LRVLWRVYALWRNDERREAMRFIQVIVAAGLAQTLMEMSGGWKQEPMWRAILIVALIVGIYGLGYSRGLTAHQ
jgi:hypothetical protein